MKTVGHKGKKWFIIYLMIFGSRLEGFKQDKLEMMLGGFGHEKEADANVQEIIDTVLNELTHSDDLCIFSFV